MTIKLIIARHGRFCAAMLAALFLAACAAATPRPDPVVERAEARWAALLADDLETAYTYYSPGFRSANSLIDFGVSIRSRKVRWTSAAYKEHDCEETRCIVSFDVGYKVNNPVPGVPVYEGSNVIRETWVKTDGQWWYVPKKH